MTVADLGVSPGTSGLADLLGVPTRQASLFECSTQRSAARKAENSRLSSTSHSGYDEFPAIEQY